MSEQLTLFEQPTDIHPHISLEEVFEAYYSCRKNKRNTANALAFEVNYETNLVRLWQDINDGSYDVGRSMAFIVHKPVTREIFAADFRDRVVHHLIINKLNPIFEKQFIYDSYGCRSGKGTLFGIHRVDRFIRKCSANYTKDCYVLKLDIEGFFMHINKRILFNKVVEWVHQYYHEDDKSLLIQLIRKVIFNNPTKNCYIKGRKNDWKDLPKHKSLYHSPVGCGLPIGNLTSQIFANVYMNGFDHHVKNQLGIRYYGRYVDDFIIIHQDKTYLSKLVPSLSTYLQSALGLKLHPRKFHLQHYTKGVSFLGAYLMPGRLLPGKRLTASFRNSIYHHNAIVNKRKPLETEIAHFQSSVNSYLGYMGHFKSHQQKMKILFQSMHGISGWWYNHIYWSGGLRKLVRKRKVTLGNICYE